MVVNITSLLYVFVNNIIKPFNAMFFASAICNEINRIGLSTDNSEYNKQSVSRKNSFFSADPQKIKSHTKLNNNIYLNPRIIFHGGLN